MNHYGLTPQQQGFAYVVIVFLASTYKQQLLLLFQGISRPIIGSFGLSRELASVKVVAKNKINLKKRTREKQEEIGNMLTIRTSVT